MAQQRLAANKRYASRNSDPAHRTGPAQALLHRDMARCGICHAAMDTRPRDHRYDPQEGARLFRYRCSTHRRNKSACAGVGWTAQAEVVDRAVWAALVDTLRQPDLIARLARFSQDNDQANAGEGTSGVTVVTPVARAKALQHKLADAEQELQNLTLRSAAIPAGNPAAVGFDLAISAKGAEVLSLREDCARAEAEARKYRKVEQAIGEWEDYLQLWRDNLTLFSTRSYPAASRRALLEALGAEVLIQPRRADGNGQGHGPLAVLRLHLKALDRRSVGIAPPTGEAEPPVEVPVLPLPAQPWRQGMLPPLPAARVPGGIYDAEAEAEEEVGGNSAVIAPHSSR